MSAWVIRAYVTVMVPNQFKRKTPTLNLSSSIPAAATTPRAECTEKSSDYTRRATSARVKYKGMSPSRSHQHSRLADFQAPSHVKVLTMAFFVFAHFRSPRTSRLPGTPLAKNELLFGYLSYLVTSLPVVSDAFAVDLWLIPEVKPHCMRLLPTLPHVD